MISYRNLAMRALNHAPCVRGGGGKPLTRRLAALAVAAALMAGTAVPAFAEVYDIGAGSITIEANGDGTAKVTQNENVTDKDDDVAVTGSNAGTSNAVDIINNTDDDLKVTLSDVTITDTKGDAAVSVSGTGDTTIELNGSNTLESSGWHAGLERNEEKDSAGNVVSGKLTIQDEEKNGSLDATGGYGGAGIGGANLNNSGAIEITGGTITATGTLDGAGIGGGYASAGDVTIEGGTTVSAAGGVGGGAGIGGGADLEGNEDTRNRVTIRSNGDGSPDVSAVGGAPEPGQDGEDASKGGAAIGSGALIEPDEDAAEADADITIEGKVTISAVAGKDGVAIGANGKEQAFDGLLPGSSIDRRNTDGKDISLPGDKTAEKTPAVESANSGRLDAPTGLTVTDAAGKAVAYTLTWQDGTVTVRVDAAFASLQMTYDALCWLHSHGMQTILFCTQECTASVSAVELLGVCTQGTTVVWNNDGASSALRVNGADHSTLLK